MEDNNCQNCNNCDNCDKCWHEKQWKEEERKWEEMEVLFKRLEKEREEFIKSCGK